MSFFRELGKLLRHESEEGQAPPDRELTIHPVDSDAVLREALEHSNREPIVFFKHSKTCAISSMMRRRILHLHEDTDPSVYEIIVQTARPLSQKLEHLLGIRHESPQVIVIHKQTAIYNASHGRISAEDVRAVAAQALETS